MLTKLAQMEWAMTNSKQSKRGMQGKRILLNLP